MISHFRSSWHNESWGAVSDGFPVYFTQLPSWNPPQSKPVEGQRTLGGESRKHEESIAGVVQHGNGGDHRYG